MYVYSSIISSNDIKETPINKIKAKKLSTNSILVFNLCKCLYIYIYIRMFI
jgi:hypothetical protein